MREIELTKEQIADALRDVDENNGRMCGPGTDAEIIARWKALRGAGYVHIRRGRNCLTDLGRTALKEASHAD